MGGGAARRYLALMHLRITPSFVVAVLALLVAVGGTSYAAGRITSAQIEDETIQSRDVRNGSLQGRDLANGSVPRSKLDRRCGAGQAAVFGGCVRLTPYARATHDDAVDRCNSRGGRLPTTGELRWIATHDEFTWANGDSSQYEFSGSYDRATDAAPYTPMAFDKAFNPIVDASAQSFLHHCITY